MHQSLFHLMKALPFYTQMLLESGAQHAAIFFSSKIYGGQLSTKKDSKPNTQMMTLIVSKYTS